MKYHEFEDLVARQWRRIPDHFKGGVDALVVERDAKAHPRKKDVFTLGECVTETYLSDFGGPDTTRSVVVLYYGSFHRLARLDPQFDWQDETWETLTHELQHHLESLAAEDGLEDLDVAVDQNYQRIDGDAFDPLFYLSGVAEGGGWYRVEDCWFYETDVAADARVTFEWEGRPYAVPVPDQPCDYLFITVLGVEDPPEDLCVVLRNRKGGLRSLLEAGSSNIVQVEANAEPLPPAAGGAA